ncbi:Hypothetical predicted protein, partial [Pelobates cultripes]
MLAGLPDSRLGAYTTQSRGEAAALPTHQCMQHPLGPAGVMLVPIISTRISPRTSNDGTRPNYATNQQAASYFKMADVQPKGDYAPLEYQYSTNEPLSTHLNKLLENVWARVEALHAAVQTQMT